MWMCGDKVGAAADLKKLSVHPQAQMHSTVLYFRQRAVCSTKKPSCGGLHCNIACTQTVPRHTPRIAIPTFPHRDEHPQAPPNGPPPPLAASWARPPWTAGVPVAGHGSRSGDWCGESEFFYIYTRIVPVRARALLRAA
jgi:hypothetical protein